MPPVCTSLYISGKRGNEQLPSAMLALLDQDAVPPTNE
jgi:hypothetical protein